MVLEHDRNVDIVKGSGVIDFKVFVLVFLYFRELLSFCGKFKVGDDAFVLVDSILS